MKIKNGFTVKRVVDEYMLLPTGDNIKKFGGSVIINEVTAYILELLKKDVTEEEIVNAVVNEYEVGKDVAEGDVQALILKLKDYGIIDD